MSDWLQLLQIIGPPVAVYIGIRVDQATMKVRLDHLERDFYTRRDHA
jgi:hypothetical protein